MTDSFGGAPNDNRSSQGRLVAATGSVPAIYGSYGQVGGYGLAPPDDGPQLFPFIRELLRVLLRRKWLILAIVLASLAVGAVRTLLVVPVYTAGVRMQVDREGARAVERGYVSPDTNNWDMDFLKTQHELLLSRTVAERVASSLKLGEDPDFLAPRELSLFQLLYRTIGVSAAPAQATGAKTNAERAAVGVVLGNRVVKVVTGSRMIDVKYSDPNPARAQRVAMAYANAFMASNLDKRFQANADAKIFLEDQLKQLKLRLEASEKTLLEFAEKEQIVAATEKSSIAENNLAAANSALGSLIADRIKNEQLWRQIETATPLSLPQVLSNSVIANLRDAKSVLVRDYQEKLETFKPGYPLMVQMSNKIAEIDRQLVSEVNTLKESFKAAYESSKSQEVEMLARIETLKAEVLDLQKRSIQYNILKREVDTSRSLYDGLLQRFSEVGIASGASTNNIFIVDKAEVPGSPSSPVLSSALMMSFAFGLFGGVAAAYLLERLDDTVKSVEEIEQLFGLPPLGVIPKVRSGASVEDELADPQSALSEAYRSLCTSLQFSTDSGLPKTLLVTSTGPAEGKSITSYAMARHFAVLGLKVLLVDADLRNPSLHKKLALDNEKGLSNYLTGGSTPPEVFQGTETPNLVFMSSGPPPPNAADLLGSARLMSLLTVGLEVFDLIVLDGPPVMGLADAPLLSNAAAGTVFVIGASDVRTGMVRGALKRLQFARAPILGAVLTKYVSSAAGYGYGYGYGYYGYGYGSNGAGQASAPAVTDKRERRAMNVEESA